MKVIIAGSRCIESFDVVVDAIKKSDFIITEVVSGAARGVDKLGERWAEENRVPVKKFPADWNKYGKSAGYRRNEQMAKYANALIAVWDGESSGTKHMLDLARQAGLSVYVYVLSSIRYAASEGKNV